MGRSEQAKGRRGEIELARLLQEAGYDVHPGDPLNYGTEPDITGLEGVHAEVKRHERLEIPAWLRQARADADRFGDGLPAVFFRQNRQGWAVVMELGSFLKLYEGGERNEYTAHNGP